MLCLLLNVIVLVPVCAGLVGKVGWAQAAYGDDTPARRGEAGLAAVPPP